MKNLEEILNKIQSKRLSEAEKGVLWSRIQDSIGERRKTARDEREVFGFSVKLATSFALIVILFASGSVFTMSKADASVPGDLLFAADVFIEDVGLVFSLGESKAIRRIEIANERLYEAEQVVDEARKHGSDADDINEVCVLAPERVLNVALSRIEGIRNALIRSGSLEDVASVDGTIDELLGLAVGHVEHLEEVAVAEDAEIQGITPELLLEIRKSEDKIKFKFDHIVVESDENDSVSSDADESGESNARFNVEEQEWVKYLCHNSAGQSYTIAVGSPAAERAHLAHGDTEGRCSTGSEEVRGVNIETDNESDRGSSNNSRGSKPE